MLIIAPTVPDGLDTYANSVEFEIVCSQKAQELARHSTAEESDLSDDPDSLFSDSDTASTAPTDVDSSYEPSKLEAYFYYAGVAPRGHWPRLIFRDSEDVFEEPAGPDTRVRKIRLAYFPDTHEFAHNGLWEQVRDWVAAFLISKVVSVSSVDFVRFQLVKEGEDQEISSDEEEGAAVVEEEGQEVEAEARETMEDAEKEDNPDDEDLEALDRAFSSIALIKPVKDSEDVYSNATIWIGVLPDTLTGTVAHKLTQEIRTYFDGLQLEERVDIAFRESIARSLFGNGPELFAPVEAGDPLQEFIDNVSVALSLPIAGRKTTMQGTMGPYFQHDGKLYGITARHNLFLANDGNRIYKYKTSTIQARIHNLGETVKTLKIKITSLEDRVANGIGPPATHDRLEENRNKLTKIERKIVVLKGFFISLSRYWSKLSDRVIGHVVYAPPIAIGVGPSRFTQDFCIVELDKSKFSKFVGNILSLGPEYSSEDLTALISGMLTADDINSPNTLNAMGDPIRRVIKRGFKTNTTVGTLSRFKSFVRHYFANDTTAESLELPILPHENETGEFVGLLTGGTNKGTDGSDITFATLFEYIWELVQKQFPGANLYWEDIPAFLAAVPAAV